MRIGSRHKDRFENWQLCSVWKLSFSYHRSVKLARNCVCSSNPCIYLFVPPSATRAYRPGHLKFSTCCIVMSRTCSGHCVGFLWKHNPSVDIVLILIAVWAHAVVVNKVYFGERVQTTLASWRNGWSCSFQQWHHLSSTRLWLSI